MLISYIHYYETVEIETELNEIIISSTNMRILQRANNNFTV